MHTEFPSLRPVPTQDCRKIRGIWIPKEVQFRQIILTGPPGVGKSTLIRQIRGWPEEGYIDLAYRGWWKAQALALRPREVHLGIPFRGQEESLALFEPAWLARWDQLVLDLDRIQLPPPKRFFWSVNWYSRFVFEFLLPSPERILALRRARAERGTHPIDHQIDLAQIRRQVALFGAIAAHFHRNGMWVLIREDPEAPPSRIADA